MFIICSRCLYQQTQHKYEHITENSNQNEMMFSMIFAILLSTASARVLGPKSYPCDTDYQPPNYWGKCGKDGVFINSEIDFDSDVPCRYLVLLVPEKNVGNNSLTIEITFNHGDKDDIYQDLGLNEFGYYSLIIHQTFWYGPDVDITFFLNGTMVHKGNYQQNYCGWEEADIHTNDPNAVTYGGSFGDNSPGHIIIKSLG
jgi:hypothetical protein